MQKRFIKAPKPVRARWHCWGVGMAVVLFLSGLCGPPLYGQTAPRRPRSRLAAPLSTAAPAPPAPAVRPPVVPSSTTERVIELSLKEAIRLALEYNLVIKRERLSPQIAHTQVVQERAVFDPVGGVDVQFSETKDLPITRTLVLDPLGNIVGEERIRPFTHRDEFTPRWQHKVLLGGNYEIRFINSRQDVSPSQFGLTGQIADPRFESRVELSFTQPLLRDFGIAVNRAFIRQAEQGELIAEQQVVQAILDTLFAVQQRYWELVFRVQDLEVKRESQQLAEQFLAENKLRVELGLLPPVELIQAETRIKTRQADTIRAAAAVRTAEDQLKVVLNVLGIVGTWQVRIRPTDHPPFTPLLAISLEEQVALALKKRPDFVRSQLEVATREIARDFARNQRLPRLDIVSRFSVQAFGEGFDESTGRLRNAEGYAWTIGLRFEQPLGNRFAGNELLKRKLELQQTLMDQQQLLLTIVQEVAQAIRDIETFQEEVQVTRAGTALAHDQLEAEEEKFRLGLTTSFNVLELQEDLSIARTDETRVLSDYNIALARLDQLTGSSNTTIWRPRRNDCLDMTRWSCFIFSHAQRYARVHQQASRERYSCDFQEGECLCASLHSKISPKNPWAKLPRLLDGPAGRSPGHDRRSFLTATHQTIAVAW